MKVILASMVAAAVVVLSGSTACAHGDEYCDENYYDGYHDHVTQIDHYGGADVTHYDHHHRYVYTDEYGNVIGERVVHHDHHYVAPRYRHYHRVGWFFGY